MPFSEKQLKDALKNYFGFDKFKGEQEKIIKSVLSGNDTFVIMPTGGGKSLCYQLPAILSDGCAIIISPLIALMKNQVDLVRSYSNNENIAHFLNSSLTKAQRKRVKEDVVSGKTKMLYVAPETLTKEDTIEFLASNKVSFVAVDEAHCISEWGHDFRPEYRRIRHMVESINDKVALVALTATATPKVQSDIMKTLKMVKPGVFLTSFNRPNLYYEVRPKGKRDAVIKDLVKFIKTHKGKSGIIYSLTRKSTEELAEALKVNGVKALAYHAGLEAVDRAGRQDAFLNEDMDVIVATIAFGMGIDKPNVRYVIHYNIPKSLENYYQETGRAGRDGMEGMCIAYYNYGDIEKLEKFMRDKNSNEREIGGHLLMETAAYAETSICRRRFLLHYFGEEYPEDNCGNCDNCLHPKEKIEGMDYIMMMLECVKELKESFNIEYIVKVLSGSDDTQITTYGHDELESYGKGDEKDVHFWNSIIRQAILRNLMMKDIEDYGVIKLTKEGKAFMKKPYSIELTLNHDFENVSDDDADMSGGGAGTAALDETLLELLKDVRKQTAKKHNVQDWVVFMDPALQDMATLYPTTVQELTKCSGVSTGKAQKFGKAFIETIEQYVEENEIEKPEDLIVKVVPNKSGHKIKIIQNIDKKTPLSEIGRISEMKPDDLFDELNSIVLGGTRLNLDYIINDIMEEDRAEELFDYFRTAKTDSIEDALKELQDDFSREEVLLMRLKYLSIVAN